MSIVCKKCGSDDLGADGRYCYTCGYNSTDKTCGTCYHFDSDNDCDGPSEEWCNLGNDYCTECAQACVSYTRR